MRMRGSTTIQIGTFYTSSEEFTGPDDATDLSLLATCCFNRRKEHVRLLISAGADVNSDAGSSVSAMCTAAEQGDVTTMTLLTSKVHTEIARGTCL